MNILYKYFSINEFLYATLINNEIWFSNPNNFNDPFDCNLKAKYVMDKVSAENMQNELRGEYNSAINNESFFRHVEISNKIQQGYEQKRKQEIEKINSDFQSIISETGISCFSQKKSNILMWSHYADSHQGVCLQFNTSDKEFFDDCQKVEYRKGFPALDAEIDRKKALRFLFATKSKEWQYEDEVRLIKKSNQLFKFNPKCLEAIYFGVKCSETNFKTVNNLIQGLEKYQHVSCIKMKKSEEGFELLTE